MQSISAGKRASEEIVLISCLRPEVASRTALVGVIVIIIIVIVF